MKAFSFLLLLAISMLVSSETKAHTKIYAKIQVMEALHRNFEKQSYELISGMDRFKVPVTLSIPLPGDVDMPLLSADKFTLISENPNIQVRDVQIREISRWPHNNRIQWVLVDTLVDIKANEKLEHLVLVMGTTEKKDEMAVSYADKIVINTGVAQFTIAKERFRLLDQVIVNGKELISPKVSKGLVLIDEQGVEYLAAKDAQVKVSIEENGPVRSVITASGFHYSNTGFQLLGFHIQMTFIQGKSYVQMKISLENASKNKTQNVAFQSYSLSLKTPFVKFNYLFNTHNQEWDGNVAPSDNIQLFQGINNLPNIWGKSVTQALWPTEIVGYTLKNNTTEITKGDRLSPISLFYAQAFEINSRTITFGSRFAAAYWPQSLEISGDGTIQMGIFPKNNDKSHVIPFHSHRTFDVFVHFSDKKENGKETFFPFQYPLIGRLMQSAWRNQLDTSWLKIFDFEQEMGVFKTFQWPTDTEDHHVEKRRPTLSFPRFIDWKNGSEDPSFVNPEIQLVNFWRQKESFASEYYLQSEALIRYIADNSIYRTTDFLLSQVKQDVPTLLDGTKLKTSIDLDKKELISKENSLIPHSIMRISALRLWFETTGDRRFQKAYQDWMEYTAFHTDTLKTTSEIANVLFHFTDYYRMTKTSSAKEKATKLFEKYILPLPEKDKSHGIDPQRGFYISPLEVFGRKVHFSQQAQLVLALSYFHDFASKEDETSLLSNSFLASQVRDKIEGLSQFLLQEGWYQLEETPTHYGFLQSGNVDEKFPVDPRGTTDWGNGLRDMFFPFVSGFIFFNDPTFLQKGKLLLKASVSDSSLWHKELLTRQMMLYALDYETILMRWKKLPLKIQKQNETTYQLSWKQPFGTQQYWFKFSEKEIVTTLGFEPKSRTFQHNPSQSIAFFSANNVPIQPKVSEDKDIRTLLVTVPKDQKTSFAAKYFTSDPRDPFLNDEWEDEAISSKENQTKDGGTESLKEPSLSKDSKNQEEIYILSGGCLSCSTGNTGFPVASFLLVLGLGIVWRKNKKRCDR